MAASLGLSHETYSYLCYPSSFLVDRAPNFPAAVSDFLELDERPFECSPTPVFAGDRENELNVDLGNDAMRRGNGRIGFRMRSEVEVLDDGFKWRKYGKKAVKNSPNPRNYYRCSTEGCGVKKRVERDRDDPRYVITTYDGVHNHASPSAAVFAGQRSASPGYSDSVQWAPWGVPPAAAHTSSESY